MHSSAYLRSYSVIHYRPLFLACLACFSSLTLESNSPGIAYRGLIQNDEAGAVEWAAPLS